jgi:hypothetical protein
LNQYSPFAAFAALLIGLAFLGRGRLED